METDLWSILFALEKLDHLKHLQSPDIHHIFTPRRVMAVLSTHRPYLWAFSLFKIFLKSHCALRINGDLSILLLWTWTNGTGVQCSILHTFPFDWPTMHTDWPLFTELHVLHDTVDVVNIILVLQWSFFSIRPGGLIGHLLQQNLTLLLEALQGAIYGWMWARHRMWGINPTLSWHIHD